ncbi:hypothetical protein HMI56_001580 [Coelomomyces lativittatus]|nr:hypothetical protein HMI56_001580 [Coelomomyces lativittatus]
MEGSPEKSPKIQNQVHNDAIWRQLIQKEFQCSRDWQTRWSFMTEENYPYSNTTASTSNHSLSPTSTSSSFASSTPKPLSSLDHLASVFPVKQKFSESPAMQDVYTHGIKHTMRRSKNHTYSTSHPIPPSTSSMCHSKDLYFFPPTSSSQYGWIWQEGNKLDPYHGQQCKGKQDILRWWGGTRESMP